MLKAFIAIMVALGIIGGYVFLTTQKMAAAPPNTDYEYFWGEGCDDCKKVSTFLTWWEQKDKVKIEEKETWRNSENANLLAQRARTCNIKPGELSVPLLVTPEGKCISGEKPIIDLLSNLQL